jgi:hypothetical protein
MLLELGTVLGRFLSKLRILSVKSRTSGAKKILTATIDRREVAFGHKTLHARRFGIGRRQKCSQCYATVSKATGEKGRRRRTDPKCAHEAQATKLDSGRYRVHVSSHAKCGTEQAGQPIVRGMWRYGAPHSTRMMTSVVEDTKIANGTKRAAKKSEWSVVGLNHASETH